MSHAFSVAFWVSFGLVVFTAFFSLLLPKKHALLPKKHAKTKIEDVQPMQ